MTEAKWLATNNTTEALRYLCGQTAVTRSKAGRRKLRLFACACCRRVWDVIPEGVFRQAVVVAEHWADGLVEEAEVETVREQCVAPAECTESAAMAARLTLSKEIRKAALDGTSYASWGFGIAKGLSAYEAQQRGLDVNVHGFNAVGVREREAKMPLLRDIVGNPFRPVSIDPTWLRSTTEPSPPWRGRSTTTGHSTGSRCSPTRSPTPAVTTK